MLPQAVLAEYLDGAGLRSLVSHFLEKRYLRTGRHLPRAAVENAVFMKINLATVLGFEKAESGRVVKTRHSRGRRSLVVLDMAPHAPCVVLELPASPLERVVQGDHRVEQTIVAL